MSGNKKAVHVKWAGKTIALGTFPIAEADDKCARAKALTRAWRSTMRPKPSRDWVMLELERLNVRVVSGRLGQKEGAGSDDNSDEEANNQSAPNAVMSSQVTNGVQNSLQGDMLGRRNAVPASMLNGNVADMRRNSLSGLDPNIIFNQQLRNNSLNLSSLMDSSGGAGAAPGAGGFNNGSPDKGSQSLENTMPQNRPYVGGGSAAAYEAARADHYRKLAEQKQSQGGGNSGSGSNNSTSNKSSGINGPGGSGNSNGIGTLGNVGNGASGTGNSTGGTPGGLPSNANQHYEMLKLHHMNLLNEIQETTLMMNLYQQQQVHQQQQQQQKVTPNRLDPQMSLMTQQQLMDQNHQMNSLNAQVSGSRGGGSVAGSRSEERSRSNGSSRNNKNTERKNGNNNTSGSKRNHNGEEDPSTDEDEQSPEPQDVSEQNDRLQKIKDEIAERQRMVEELEMQQQRKSKRPRTENEETSV